MQTIITYTDGIPVIDQRAMNSLPEDKRSELLLNMDNQEWVENFQKSLEQPAPVASPDPEEEEPEGTPQATEQPDTTSDDENLDLSGESPDVEADWTKPFRDAGIPESQLIDPATGEYYENKRIRGRYDTVDKFWNSLEHAYSAAERGRATRDDMRAIAPDEYSQSEPGELQAALAERATELMENSEVRGKVHEAALRSALVDFTEQLVAAGYEFDKAPAEMTSEEARELMNSINRTDAGIYAEIRATEKSYRDEGAKWLASNQFFAEHGDEVNSAAIQNSFEGFVREMERYTGETADAEDREILAERFNAAAEQIQSQHANLNPMVERDAMKLRRFYDIYGGHAILNPEKVLQHVIVSQREFIASTIKGAATYSTADRLRAERLQRLSQSREAPATIAGAEGSTTGGHSAVLTPEQAFHPRVMDNLIKQFGGDMAKAKAEYQRAMDYYDRHPETYNQFANRESVVY